MSAGSAAESAQGCLSGRGLELNTETEIPWEHGWRSSHLTPGNESSQEGYVNR